MDRNDMRAIVRRLFCGKSELNAFSLPCNEHMRSRYLQFRNAGPIGGALGVALLCLVWAVPAARAAAPVKDIVRAIAVSGSDVYVGGSFTNLAGIPEADYIARWNGSTWSALGSNGAGNGALNSHVIEITIDGGTVYAGGQFTDAGGDPAADYVAKWSGSTWSAIAPVPPTGSVQSIGVSGTDIYVGGIFYDVAGLDAADMIAKWNGSTWSALGANNLGDGAVQNVARDICILGGDVFVVGPFVNVADIPEADGVARWNGAGWSALGSDGAGDGALSVGYNWQASACAISGTNLVVGGAFTDVQNIPAADLVAVWNGSNWSALGGYGGDGAIGGQGWNVQDIAVSGSDIFVTGGFVNAFGNAKADRIAKWNGSSWSALGSNGSGNGALNNWGQAIGVSGGTVYVGGGFTNAGGDPEADYLAQWNGAWSAVGSGPLGFVAKPDGRIRKGNGSLVGNNIYSGSGNQSVGGSGSIGDVFWFKITIQNDGNGPDQFAIDSGCAAGPGGITIKYLRGNTTTNITSAVSAGTYITPTLAPGATHLIRAKVKITSSAPKGSVGACAVTATSVADPVEDDTVGFHVTRN